LACCKTHAGSLFIQNALATATAEDFEMVFEEIISGDVVSLCKSSPYANYVTFPALFSGSSGRIIETPT